MRIIIGFVLCGASFMHAMDLGIVSFVCNKVSGMGKFFKKPVIVQQCYFDQLPLTVQGEIFKNRLAIIMSKDVDSEDAKKKYEFIDQIKLKNYVLEVPLLLGVKFFNEFFQIQKMCESEIGGKRFVASELLCLPQKERDVFIRIANRSFMQRDHIDVADYEVISKISQKDITKGLSLEVRPLNKVFIFFDKIRNVGFLGVFMGILTLLVLCTSFEKYQSVLSPIPFVSMFGGLGLVFFGGGTLAAFQTLYPDKEFDTKKIKME